MATIALNALWITDKPVDFSEGSCLDTELTNLTVVSADERLPIGFAETYKIRVELKNGRMYEGQATSKMPRDVGGRQLPTMHIYEFVATPPLSPVN